MEGDDKVKIKTEREPLIWRNCNYYIDHDLKVAITGGQVSEGFGTYDRLVKKGLIRPDTVKSGFWTRLFNRMGQQEYEKQFLV